MNKIIRKKIKECYYKQVVNGYKNFEIRKEDDCRYFVGDILILEEIDVLNEYTGRVAMCSITSVIRGFEGLVDGYVALGIRVKRTYDFNLKPWRCK